jgi:hypothetical protein
MNVKIPAMGCEHAEIAGFRKELERCEPAFYSRGFRYFSVIKGLTLNHLHFSNLALPTTVHTAPGFTFSVRFSTGSWIVWTVTL